MMHRIGLVVFDGMTLLDASGPAEVFRLSDRPGTHYEMTIVSPSGGAIRSSSGIEIASTASGQLDTVDTLIVVGGENLVEQPLSADLLATTARLAEGASRVASVCTGAFVLAELGLLNGRRATTHWRYAAELARRYPLIRVEPDVIHIRDGRYLSSAGITAGIDLALAMVEDDTGAEAARTVARELVMFMQRPGGQSQYSSALRRPAVDNEPLRRLMDAVIAAPGEEHTLPAMAQLVGVSTRHLSRLFQTEVGTTPARWLEEIRVDAARALILEGHPVSQAAQLSGFGSDETQRRAFARHLGTTPSTFRDRFATTRAATRQGQE
ncbi:transcriptional regulator GlxA family with amidase domain [Leucobacter exalbidus]|uniref:Transcriptional regulator GlxA family with amidase domain n=1 Tax=Leucobacter exalbidus TaxID=662960 RepID=A0A940PYL7_9MICO|nr:GlxA family transcriptional regulator [Leucobacter exalbidus]MBP1327441.1 transcriptional regulator GlxA family with amidase domain [Leucobacter exalbidus]